MIGKWSTATVFVKLSWIELTHSYGTFKPIHPFWVKDGHSACDRVCNFFLKKAVVKLYTLVTEFASSTAEWLSLSHMSTLWGWLWGAGACWDVPGVSCCLCGPRTAWCVAAMEREAAVEKSLCTALQDHLTQPLPASAPFPHKRLSVPTWPVRGKKVKTEGFSTPGSAAQDPIHLPPLLQDDFIFQIHKYFPVKALEIQERACAWLPSLSVIWGLWGTSWLLCVCFVKIMSFRWCAVSVTARGLKGPTKVCLKKDVFPINEEDTLDLVVFWGGGCSQKKKKRWR